MDNIIIIEETTDKLAEYSKISIAFEVASEYKIKTIKNGLGGFLLEEEKVSSYLKDFDTDEHNPSTLA